MKIWKPVLSVAIFLTVQGVGGIIAMLLFVDKSRVMKEITSVNPEGNLTETMSNIEESMSIPSDTLAWTTVITGILSVAIIALALRTIHLKGAFTPSGIKQSKNWLAGLIGIVAACVGLFSTNLLSEQIDLPNWLESDFMDMSKSLIGAISIAIVAPIVEELIFRESIEGHLLRHGCKPWIAITASALAFGLIHFNPAQVPFAAIIGVILGILYWKTKNIWLCSIVHIANNSLAVYMMYELGEKANEYSYSSMLGSTASVWLTMAGTMLACAALLWWFCKLRPTTLATNE